ncbi:MAG TPA: glycosyltransferase [Lacipirellulaceae bacterium]|nr:glycosyltransferase [Lacipirellulaceae bacterium]
MATLRIVHTVNSVDPTQGGPSRTVPALCGHLAQERPDWRIQLVTSRAELARVVAASPPDLIHDHGQWLPLNHSAARAARRTGVPRIVSPRGMLSPWSRRHRQWKKKLAWALYAGRDMASAAVIHATSDLEMQELRELGVRQPIAVIPNGVDQPPLVAGGGASEARPYVLFMSRVHEKKGVRELLEAWQSLDRGPWELVLAGPDEQGLMKRLSMPPGARYVGMVDGEAKTRLLAEASLFVLPSYSENFGVVVAEAMMAAVPVIATHGTPWKILADEGCGWWIPMEQDRLASTLKSAMAETAHALHSMGERGRAVAMAHFGWPRIASDMAAVYAWVLNGGSVPQCVDRR